MYNITGKNIYLSAGDTLPFYIDIDAGGFQFGQYEEYENKYDIALFTVKNGSGKTVLVRTHDLSKGDFLIELKSTDTKDLSPGSYSYDVRFLIGCRKVGDTYTLADQVITPEQPGTITIVRAIGEV